MPSDSILRSELKHFIQVYLPAFLVNQIKKYHYAHLIRRSTFIDDPYFALLPRLVNAGNVCIDIGANVGVSTKHLSVLAGDSGKVLSIEPIAQTFSYLQSNASRLGLSNVEFHNCALSDKVDFADMRVPNWPDGTPNFYKAHVAEIGIGNVPTTTLDNLCSNLTRVDFVNCNIEGYEWHVLQGAINTISRFHPKWLIETNLIEVFKFFSGLGYACFVESRGELRRHVKRESSECRNRYFFISNSEG